MDFGGELVGRKAEPRRSHIKRRKIGAAEGASSGSADRQLHRPVDPSVRRIAEQAATVEYRVPDEAFGIDRRAIGHAGPTVHGRKHAARTDPSRSEIEVVDEDGPHMAVGKIHPGVVRAPEHAVGDPDAVVDGVQMSALKSIEAAALALHRFAHGADPKSPAPVAASVIEDVDRAAGLRIDDAIELSACRIVVSEAARPSTILCQRAAQTTRAFPAVSSFRALRSRGPDDEWLV